MGGAAVGRPSLDNELREATTIARHREPRDRGEPSVDYRPDIDGLRAVAVTSVVLFHAGVWPLRSGYVGVDIFFVISGFLIGRIIYRGAATHSFSFAAFYARRARRILPMLFVIVIASLVAGLLVLSASELQRLAESAASATAAGSNFYFWWTRDYFSQNARLDPMLMTWSLGVEEQFYLFFPLFMLAMARLRESVTVVALVGLTGASLALSVVAITTAPAAAFYLLPTRSWELGAGAVLAVWQSQGGKSPTGIVENILSIAGMLAIALSITAFNENRSIPGAAGWFSVLGTVALIASERSWINSRLLAHPLPVRVGLVSYSWYLWHWPLIAFAYVCCVGTPPVSVLSSLVLLALLPAAVSWRFVERRFRRPVHSSGSTILTYALASGALIAASVGLKLANGFPQRVSPEVAQFESAITATHTYACVTYGSIPKTASPCISSEGDQPVIAIIGDSHAAALAQGLQVLAKQRGWGFEVFAKPSCRPLRGVTVWRRDQPNLAQDCADFMNSAFSRVSSDPAVDAVILAGLWFGPISNPVEEERYSDLNRSDPLRSRAELFGMGLDGAVRRLMLAGKRVILAGDVPYWPFDPARGIIQAIPVRAAIERLIESGSLSDDGIAETKLRNKDVDRMVRDVAQNTGARLIDPASALCANGICHTRDGKLLFYADASHLTEQGAIRALMPWAEVIFESVGASQRPASIIGHQRRER